MKTSNFSKNEDQEYVLIHTRRWIQEGYEDLYDKELKKKLHKKDVKLKQVRSLRDAVDKEERSRMLICKLLSL